MHTPQALTRLDDALLDHPRRSLFLRLVAAWLVLTSLCAFAAWRFGISQVDAQLADRVRQETVRYAALFSAYAAAPDTSRKARLDAELARLTSDGFRIIRLYDADGNPAATMQSPGASGYEAALAREAPARPDRHTEIWRRISLFGQPHMLMVGPIHDPNGALVGYGSAIYRFDRGTIESLEGLVRMVSLMTAATVLASFAMVYPLVAFLNRRLLRSARELMSSNIGTLKTLGSAIAKRDGDTALHNYRVTIYAVRLAETLQLDRKLIQRLIIGSFLHDIGKIATPDTVLLKEGGHDEAEKRIMRQHVGHGVDIVKQYPWLASGVDVVAGHHERYDGSGYPLGLKGDETVDASDAYVMPGGIDPHTHLEMPFMGTTAAETFESGIFAVADVFDALASTRPYKRPYPYDKIIDMLTGELANQFDPTILRAFVPISGELHAACAGLDEARADALLNEIVARYFPGARPDRRERTINAAAGPHRQSA